jgi:hypothetical protein
MKEFANGVTFQPPVVPGHENVHDISEMSYRNGYEKGLEDGKPKWIPVSERLPDSNRTVLVSALTKCFRHRHTLMASHVGHHEFTTEDIEWREYEGETEYDEENDCFWIPECWYEVNAIDDNGNWVIDSEYDVTHWMPLPERPKED